MAQSKAKWFAVGAVLLLMFTAFPSAGSISYAQGSSRTFPETGHTVKGRFLDYWNTHGGLAQQGYPISEEMQEVSDTDGRTYTVQYFERAIFELHPENAPPYDVLLSLLGNFLYKQKYAGGAPGQAPNNAAPTRFFTETGHRVGGVFLDYWNNHGGLAQQGYPISDEFNEVSDLDGKTYRVQYFERAVFELHPENAPPYNVLLSQLGKFRYNAKYVARGGGGGGGGGVPPAPTATPKSAPPPPSSGCDTSGNKNGVSDKTVIHAGESFRIAAQGFTPGEPISYWFTLPSGDVIGTASPIDPQYLSVNPNGTLGPFTINTTAEFAAYPGRWALTFEGAYSHNQAIIYFCVTR